MQANVPFLDEADRRCDDGIAGEEYRLMVADAEWRAAGDPCDEVESDVGEGEFGVVVKLWDKQGRGEPGRTV